MNGSWLVRIRFPDDAVRVVPVHTEPREGELLDADLPGQWLISVVEPNHEPDKLEIPYDVTLESAEGVSG
jgi:hypothetical protein